MASQVSNVCRSAYYHLFRIAKIRGRKFDYRGLQDASARARDISARLRKRATMASLTICCTALRFLTRFNKIATQGAPQMAVVKEANSLSRVYSCYSKFNLRLFYV